MTINCQPWVKTLTKNLRQALREAVKAGMPAPVALAIMEDALAIALRNGGVTATMEQAG